MTISSNRVFKSVTLVILLAALAACGLPQSGPNKTEILANAEFYGSAEVETVQTYVVNVDERVTRSMPSAPDLVFPAQFISASPERPSLIRPGDSLNFTVYENVDDGLFSSGAGAASVGSIQVDEGGSIFIPYAGRMRAAGNTSERLRQIVTARLANDTPRPQVLVQRSEGDGGSVTIIGNAIGGQGIFPIGRSNLTLMGMLAAAGGVVGDPGSINVIVIRGEDRAEMRYEDIYDDPRYDIALRPGDRVIVERDNRTFISLGAVSQGTNPFNKRSLSALEAIAQVGGLRETSADPTGIFVIRDEDAEVANIMLDRFDFTTEQRLIYLINLTAPSGIFHARNFNIQDGDTVYVTEAPFTQFTKVLSAITGTAFTVRNLSTLPTTIP